LSAQRCAPCIALDERTVKRISSCLATLPQASTARTTRGPTSSSSPQCTCRLKLELRARTKSALKRDQAVMIPRTTRRRILPAQEAPDMFWKGNTAIGWLIRARQRVCGRRCGGGTVTLMSLATAVFSTGVHFTLKACGKFEFFRDKAAKDVQRSPSTPITASLDRQRRSRYRQQELRSKGRHVDAVAIKFIKSTDQIAQVARPHF